MFPFPEISGRKRGGNGVRRGARICRSRDGPADHQHIRAERKGLDGRHDALLIAGVASGGADTGYDEFEIRTKIAAQRLDLMRAANDAIEPGLARQRSKAADL